MPAAGQPIRLIVTQSTETAQDFETTFTGDRKAQKRLPGEVRIQAGKVRPRSSISISWTFPAQIELGGSAPLVMAQFLYSGETEGHDYFTEIPSSYEPRSRKLSAVIDPKYFSDERDERQIFEAILAVVTSPKK